MPFIPHTETDIKEMLSDLGMKNISDVFDEIPKELPDAALSHLPKGLSEGELTRLMIDRAPAYKPGNNFIGAGAYEHFIPSAVWDITTRGEFYTAYTPYQAEVSQGTLQVIYEYQSMMTALMEMDVSNASMYDGATALTESILMTLRLTKGKSKRVLVPENLHPHYRQVLETFLVHHDVDLVAWSYGEKTGLLDINQLKAIEEGQFAAVVVSQPNFFGGVEVTDEIANIVHEKGAKLIAVVNPMAMALLKAPGQWGENGADIVCGEGQPLGVPLAGGGPYFGFMCCRKKDVRQMPGRIVGRTTDKGGKNGFVLTLQAREQHIRRSKATSNICTNQGLLVTAATIYMRIMGAIGLHKAALQSHQQAMKLKAMLADIPGVSIVFDSVNFHEFVIRFESPIEPIMQKLRGTGIQPGYVLENTLPQLKNCLLVCATETKTDADLERLVSHIKEAEAQAAANMTVPTLPKNILRDALPGIPESAELDVVRHYTKLSQKNFSIETNFYPLGSCTMKYNPRAAKHVAMLPGYLHLHPLTDAAHMQGYLQNLYELQDYLTDITGMKATSLTPMAGAQGEFAGVAMIAAYHHDRGDTERTEMLIPDAAHGTNPASAKKCGFEVKEIPTCPKTGDLDVDALRAAVGPKTAGIMLTNPSTLGVFEKQILTIAKIVHEAGGLLYYDGANLNAILGKVRPGDMGFDVMHLNLHKTFATPHGGGGPGSGAVAAGERLKDYLPTPLVGKGGADYHWLTPSERPKSIGRLSCFMGNAGVLMRAHAYIRLLGKAGVPRVGQFAALNANYLMKKLEAIGYQLAFPTRRASHEFIVTVKPLTKKTGVTALDVAKRLLDFGIHAPTIYFPLLVPECLLIEPTETENKETLDRFIEVMATIFKEANETPETLKEAPFTTPVGRLDEVKAARDLDIREVY